MTRTVVRTDDAPSSPAYSQAYRVGDLVFLSGTVGIDPVTGELPGSVRGQTRQALANCRSILAAAGAGPEHVVDVHVLLRDPEDAAGFEEGYRGFFPSDPPPRCISRLGVDRAGIRVSVKMTAVVA
jgi:2-iminobutanoate/2-iminopropanoate deaminase